jgi:hypothetical protein
MSLHQGLRAEAGRPGKVIQASRRRTITRRCAQRQFLLRPDAARSRSITILVR